MTRIRLSVAGSAFEIRVDDDGTAWIRPSKAARADEDTRIHSTIHTNGVNVPISLAVETVER